MEKPLNIFNKIRFTIAFASAFSLEFFDTFIML